MRIENLGLKNLGLNAITQKWEVKLDVGIGIGCRYWKLIPTSSNRYQHLDVGIGYRRYRVPFRTLTVPDTVTATDTGIRYRYLNGRSLLDSIIPNYHSG